MNYKTEKIIRILIHIISIISLLPCIIFAYNLNLNSVSTYFPSHFLLSLFFGIIFAISFVNFFGIIWNGDD